jgi:hypothetical protein
MSHGDVVLGSGSKKALPERARADIAEDDALFAIDYAYVTIEEAVEAVLLPSVCRGSHYSRSDSTRSSQLSASSYRVGLFSGVS